MADLFRWFSAAGWDLRWQRQTSRRFWSVLLGHGGGAGARCSATNRVHHVICVLAALSARFWPWACTGPTAGGGRAAAGPGRPPDLLGQTPGAAWACWCWCSCCWSCCRAGRRWWWCAWWFFANAGMTHHRRRRCGGVQPETGVRWSPGWGAAQRWRWHVKCDPSRSVVLDRDTGCHRAGASQPAGGVRRTGPTALGMGRADRGAAGGDHAAALGGGGAAGRAVAGPRLSCACPPRQLPLGCRPRPETPPGPNGRAYLGRGPCAEAVAPVCCQLWSLGWSACCPSPWVLGRYGAGARYAEQRHGGHWQLEAAPPGPGGSLWTCHALEPAGSMARAGRHFAEAAVPTLSLATVRACRWAACCKTSARWALPALAAGCPATLSRSG